MVIYRKLVPAELPDYKAHLLRLDEKDRRSRFLVPTSDKVIAGHCDRLDHPWTVIIGAFFDGVLHGAVELTGNPHDGTNRVELAVSIETAYQGHGAGTELVRRAVLFCQNRSIRHIQMVCLLDNRRMQYIARKFQGQLDFDEADVIADILVGPPNHISMSQEMLNDSFAAVFSMIGTWPRRGTVAGALPA